MQNIILSLVMLVLVIMTLLVFARSSATGKNNLFLMILIGIVAIIAAGYNIIKPHIGVMMTMAIGMAALFLILHWRQTYLIGKNQIPATCAKKDIHIALNMTICCFLIFFGSLFTQRTLWAWVPIAIGASEIGLFTWWNVKQI